MRLQNLRHLLASILPQLFYKPASARRLPADPMVKPAAGEKIGIIAGNGTLPLRFTEAAKREGCDVYAVCHLEETDCALEPLLSGATWIKVGELGKIIEFFKSNGIQKIALVGGVNRVRLFGGVKLDARGAALLLRLRSTKDDVIMRGIASELEEEGISVISSAVFMEREMAPLGVLTQTSPSHEEENDIAVGVRAINAMSAQDIGQLVVVRDGVVTAVEAVEGSDACIKRGGELGGKGSVVVKYSKKTQDMRFDIPVAGVRTIEGMNAAGARVLALQAGKCLLLEEEKMIALANRYRISIVGCDDDGLFRTREG